MAWVRKNFTALTTQERDRLVAALKVLKARGVVERFAKLHEHHFNMNIHLSSHFLPWHREMLLRFETGLAVSNAILCGTSLDVGSILIAFGRKPGGIEKAFGLPPNYKLTWGHAVGYPLEDLKAGGQRPRLKFEKLFSKDTPGNPWPMVDGLADALKEKGMIQEQAPTSGRIEEIEALAAKAQVLAEEWDRPSGAPDPDDIDEEIPDDSTVDHTGETFEE